MFELQALVTLYPWMVPADLVTRVFWTTSEVICAARKVLNILTGGRVRRRRQTSSVSQNISRTSPPKLATPQTCCSPLFLLRLWHHQYGVLGARSVRSRSPVHSGQCVISGRSSEELGPACLCAVRCGL
eukprot:scaffold112259_cov59-Phaeocystis_antarctica.AAC.6